jgi:hypothetical protein
VPPDPGETFVLPYEKIALQAAEGNVPPRSGEMATLYGDLDKPGPYLVMMRWNPGWFSAPHTRTSHVCNRPDLRRRVRYLVCQQRK